MTQVLKNHKWAIFLALVVVVIVAYPQLYFSYDHQDTYQGIEIMGSSHWVSRVKEVQDGHPGFGSIYLKDGKNDPYLFQPLGSIIVGYLGKAFSLDLNNTILLSRFFFPFLVFLIIYSFTLLISKDKLTALAAPTMVLLGKTLISRTGLLRILEGEGFNKFLKITSPVIPALPYFFFFSFLLFFWLFLIKKQWWWGILSTLMLGLAFYDYFYTWTFLYAFCGTLILIFLFQKKWLEIKKVTIVLLGSIVIAIPYFLNLYQASLYPNYAEVSQRFGVAESREPIFGFLIPFLFIVFLLFFPRKWKERYYFVLALIIATFIVLNQQLITGKVLQSGHYHWHFNIPLAIIFLLVIFFSWISARKWELFKKISAIAIIAVSIYAGISVQNISYIAMENEALEAQRYGPIMEWLNENAEKEEVVFANQETSHLVVTYTSLNVFHHTSIMYSLAVSQERLLNNLFVFYRLTGVGKDEVQEIFFQERAKISKLVYSIYYRELTGSYDGIPDTVVQEIVQKYQESLSVSTDVFLDKLWSKYEVKYLVWDKKTDLQWQLDQYLFLEKVAAIGDFIIYQKLN